MPSASIITVPFQRLAKMTAVNLGVPEFPVMVIDHPIWTRDNAWIESVATTLAGSVTAMLLPKERIAG